MTGAQRRRLRREIEILEDTQGSPVTPAALVDWARENPDSVAHAMFDWDDAKAARKHRIEQARALIRRVRVEIRESSTVIRAVGYVHDPSLPRRESGYTHIEHIRSDEERKKGVMADELKRIGSSARRVRRIARDLGMDMAEVEGQIRDALDAALAEEIAS